ncbi:MAG: hypothetical protein R2726_10180 [Acidimicrobiales bacterium]
MSSGAPPALLFSSTDDTTVPYASSVTTCDAAVAAGNRCTLVTYTRAGHNVVIIIHLPALRRHPRQDAAVPPRHRRARPGAPAALRATVHPVPRGGPVADPGLPAGRAAGGAVLVAVGAGHHA